MKKSLKLDTLLLFLLLAMVILSCAKGTNQEALFSPSDPADTSPPDSADTTGDSADATGDKKPVVFGWKKVTSQAAFSARSEHQVVVFKNKMYLINGYKNNIFEILADIWSSTDGKDWKEVRQESGQKLPACYLHQVVVFKNKMYLTGGSRNDARYVENIWSSSDAASWSGKSSALIFMNHQVVVFKKKLFWIAGDNKKATNKGTVYSSTDGRNIFQVMIEEVGFTARESHQVVVFKDKMYLIAGSNESQSPASTFNDIWSSSDGTNWIQETDQAPFSARRGHQVVVFKNKMYLIGGSDGSSKVLNDVWSSTDGKNWTQETDQAPFSARSGHQLVVFKNKMYLIGGHDGTKVLNDVWSYGALDEK
jgi:hypothetical protein